ncbi:MAG: hypothetical protein A2Y62_10460 [Candidatus Fischerbacteria bacterium RBG_13_37_8]|uniref:Lipoprotein n=1 Tax=Candidatus Fischerbacteria bacterium RBG_13_37_8 TaxID=1817863 RepID=A0A1F5VP00_9BACT|nr:MAG: hypothetical protein A2Y62_10460 [Candidatus Fischerbacteria bacterium RBG_13_37_8]
MKIRTLVQMMHIVIIVALIGCSGGSSPVAPPKRAVFQVLSDDRCEGTWNKDDYGVIVGCTVGNVGNACGSTGVRMWIQQKGVVREQKTKPIELCPSEKIYVETTLWLAEANMEPTLCHCQCT